MENWPTLQYSTGEDETPPETLDDDQIPPLKMNGNGRVLPKNNDIEQDPSLNKNSDIIILSSKTEVESRKPSKVPYEEVEMV